MKEFNNKSEAKRYAEYITGKELREYVSKRLKNT